MRKPIEQLSEREARARWEKLQARWRELHSQLEELEKELREKYWIRSWSDLVYAPASARKKLEKLEKRMREIENEMEGLLHRWQTRPFTNCCPAWWCWGELTWEEIRTPGQLPRVPPPAYGRTEEEMEQFAQALDSLVWLYYSHKFL
jgi:DNA repair exonuclease SbcCD ATPase subunit